MQKNQPWAATDVRGIEILNNPKLNKGTAFTNKEREDFGLVGLLPEGVETLDRQVERVLGHLTQKLSDLERYIYLIGLADRNETLFYKVLMSNPMRFLPIVYDPTIAEACLTYGHIYRRPQGMYLNKRMKGRFAVVLANWPVKDIRFICVSSGGRILGLGDIGANGAPIRTVTEPGGRTPRARAVTDHRRCSRQRSESARSRSPARRT